MSENRIPLVSRHTALAPPTAPFMDHLFELAVRRVIPWQWPGPAETPEAFSASLSDKVLVVHAIVNRETNEEVGVLIAYDANLFHRWAYVTLILLPEHQLKVWPLEGALLFANYLFRHFDLQNLYAQSATEDFLQFRSGEGTFYEVEGRLKERLLVDGVRQDQFILRVSRAMWEDKGVPLLEHCTRGVDQHGPFRTTPSGFDG